MKRTEVADKHIITRRADSRDAEVGRRAGLRRLECRLSRTELGRKIGVTSQQVQKYEEGVNRIGAGRLQRISEALNVPITFFFEVTPDTLSRGETSGPNIRLGAGSCGVSQDPEPQGTELVVNMVEEFADA